MSQSILGEVFQQVPDPWWLIDLDTSRFIDANQASVEQLGFSLEEILRIGVIDVNKAIPSAEVWRSITAGIPFGKTVRFLSELRCKSGDSVPVEVTFARVRAGDGEALLAFTRDLSKIVALEEELKDQQHLLRRLSAQVPGLLYQLQRQVDGALILSYTSDASRTLFGFEPSRNGQVNELSAVLVHMHPDDRSAFLDDLEVSSSTLMPLQREFRIVRDACVDWLEARATPERTADGTTIWHGFIALITERKLAELDLQRRKNLWEMAANAAGLGIIQFSDEGATLSFDARASQIHGGPHIGRDVASAEWLACVHPDDREGVTSRLRKASALEGIHARYRIDSSHAGQRVLELHARHFLHKTGPAVEVVGTCRDITEQVSAEQLRREKEAAERANRAKSRFLSQVSHELRTPLNGVLGFAQLMSLDRRWPLAQVQRERLATLEAAGRRLLSLINDMLDLARIEREDFTLVCAPVDAMAVVRASVAQIQPLAGLHPVLTQKEDVAWVTGNVRALEQVLTNLLSNALKYNRPGGRVRVGLVRAPTTLQIDVSDDGSGMTDEQQSRLFQPFERLGAENSHVPGTGLGLVIARELVHAMGGELLVRSTPGEGSTFSVVLWAAQPPAPALPGPRSEAPAREPVVTAPIRRKVVYIEDEAVNVLLMEEVFRLCPQWTLCVANDGSQGLQRVIDEQPDLVLVDMHLPDMDGLQLIKRLRNSEATRDRLCIALSADVLCEQVDAARRAGFDDYWTKPIDVLRVLEDLSRTMSECARA